MPTGPRVRTKPDTAVLDLGLLEHTVRGILRTKRKTQRRDLPTTKLTGFTQGVATRTFIESQQFFTVFVSIEEAEALLVVQDNTTDLRHQTIEQAFSGYTNELAMVHHTQEDLDK